jgi:hypothetical protein
MFATTVGTPPVEITLVGMIASGFWGLVKMDAYPMRGIFVIYPL